MSEQTTPAHTGDETVAAADAPLSEAEIGTTDPLATDTSQEDETSETTPSEQVDEESEAPATALSVDAGGSSAATSEPEPVPAEDQDAIMDNAGVSDSATDFIEEAWAPDDEAPAEIDESKAGGEVTSEAQDGIESGEPSETPSTNPAGDAGGSSVVPSDRETLLPADQEAIVDDAEISDSAAGFIAAAWAPDDDAPPASDEPALDGVEVVAEAETSPEASLEPSAESGEVAAIASDAGVESASDDNVAGVSESEEPAFDGGELVAGAQEAGTEPTEADQPSSERGEGIASAQDAVAGAPTGDETGAGTEPEQVAFDGGNLTAGALEGEREPVPEGEPSRDGATDVPGESATEAGAPGESLSAEPAAAARAEPVLAADAIAAEAVASNEQAEKEQAAEPAPVVVARELTWGFVDTGDRIHQKTTGNFRGRSIGKVIGSGDLQIAEFESNFGPLAKEVEILEAEVVTAKNKVAVMGRVRKMKSTAGRSEALGDFEDLFVRLHALEQTIQTEIDERRVKKESIIEKAEAIKDSTEWKVTGEAYKELFQEWKLVGATGREADDALWARFIGARELFNTRRGEHFNQRQEQWEGNRLLKQDVIVRAHELSISDQWRPTSDALRALFDEWKKIGSAGRQSDEELWQQFRGAQQHFYDRRNAAYDENRQRKDQLCQRAEDLRESTDWNATVEEMKAMMADWKTVGPTGKRDVDDALWNRFRGAQNAFFDKRYADASAREQEERSQSHRKEEITTAIEALAYSTDAVAAGEQAVELRGQFEALPSIRRDREEQLERRIRKAMGDIRVNAAAEGARRSVSWQGKLRQALERSQDQIESLHQTVANQETALDEARAKLATANEDERAGLEQQIQELNESLSYNQAEIERLKGSMSDISDNVQV